MNLLRKVHDRSATLQIYSGRAKTMCEICELIIHSVWEVTSDQDRFRRSPHKVHCDVMKAM